MAWEKAVGRFATGENYRIGKWIVAGYCYASSGSRGSKDVYEATCALPGIRSDLGRYETVELAKARVEHAVNHWLAGMQAEPAPAPEPSI